MKSHRSQRASFRKAFAEGRPSITSRVGIYCAILRNIEKEPHRVELREAASRTMIEIALVR